MSLFEFPSCDDTFLWQLIFSDYQYICYVLALKFDIFDIVKQNQPIERIDIIKKAKFDKRGGEAVINVITALGLLKCIDKKYYLTELSDNFLTEKSVFKWKSIVNLYPTNIDLYVKAIQSDVCLDQKGLIKEWNKGTFDAETAQKFTVLMQDLHSLSANGFAKKVNLRNQFSIDAFLDVGGGSGCFSVATAYHQPGIKAIVFDIEAVCKIAQTYINKTDSVKENVSTYCGNMFLDAFPDCDDEKNGYQAIFFSNVFHDWNEEKCEYLIKKSYDSLPKNGVILIHEALLNDDGNGPLTAACYSFSMFLKTEGKQFTFNELKNLLTRGGFTNIDLVPSYGIFSVVYGKK